MQEGDGGGRGGRGDGDGGWGDGTRARWVELGWVSVVFNILVML